MYDPPSQDAPWPLVIVLMILAVCALVAVGCGEGYENFVDRRNCEAMQPCKEPRP